MHMKTVQQLGVVDKADTYLQATWSIVGYRLLRSCNLGGATLWSALQGPCVDSLVLEVVVNINM